MLPALYDDERASLLRLSTMLCSISVMVLPLCGAYSYVASAQEFTAGHRYAMPLVLATPAFPPLIVARDPFVPSALSKAATSRALIAVLQAVVTGGEPRALVEFKGIARVVGLGDRIGTLRIIAIDAAGITFDNGAKIALVEHRP